jgi:hypothetical protein
MLYLTTFLDVRQIDHFWMDHFTSPARLIRINNPDRLRPNTNL